MNPKIIPSESIQWVKSIYSKKAAITATPAKVPTMETLLTEAAFGEPLGGDWAGAASPEGTVVPGAPAGVVDVGGAGGDSVGGWLTGGAVVGAEEGGLAEGDGAGAVALGDWDGGGVAGRGDMVGAGPGAWATTEEATRARKRKTTTDLEAIVSCLLRSFVRV